MKKIRILLFFSVVILFQQGVYGAEAPNIFRVENSILVQSISLSDIGEDKFDDMKDAAGSSVFYLYQKSSFFRIGGGYLSMSGETEETTLDINGGGMILEFVLGGNFEITLGALLGGDTAIAIQGISGTDEDNIKISNSYRGKGVFVSPHFSLGKSFLL